MAENNKDKTLFSDFLPVSTEDWEKKIVTDLKGADYQKKLIWRTMEGFNVKPYYRSEDLEDKNYLENLPGEFPFIRSGKKQANDWYVREDIVVEDVKKANKYALDILNKGATSLGFLVKKEVINSQADLHTLLNNIHLDCIEINFMAGTFAPQVLEYFDAEVDNRELDPSTICGSVDYDPFLSFILNGEFQNSKDNDLSVLTDLLKKYSKKYKNFHFIPVNGYHFTNSGATTVQELGYTLSVAAEYLEHLADAGISFERILKHLKLNLGVGSNYFMEIAKVRAARLLWSKIVAAYDPAQKDSANVFIHALTADANKTIYDPYVNMLRTTTESMSAALGGVNSLTVKPFDAVYRKPNAFSERIARNTQIILKEESYFDKVVDPAAGSYYIESLTDSIAENAWQVFLDTQNNGGYIAAVKANKIQDAVEESASTRLKRLAQRRDTFVGTNQYPNSLEKVKKDVDVNRAFPKVKTEGKESKTLKPFRFTIEFEKMRLKTENREEGQPKVFMLKIGDRVMRTARATFTANFFGCAGYEILDNLGYDTVEDAVKAAKESKAEIVTICSSDDEYAEFAPKINEALKDSAVVVVAGAPKCSEELKEKGVNNFIHVRSNLLETLQGFQKELGIE
jgi:methylmalonyl-CoA mutase